MAMMLEQQRAMAIAEAKMRAAQGEQEGQQSRELRSDLSAMTQNPQVVTPPVVDDRGASNAFNRETRSGLFGGFDDELAAGIRAPIAATFDWARGDGFNVADNYTRIQQELQGEKDARRSQHPGAAIGGQLVGGLALGGNLAQNGITLAGKSVPGLASIMPRTAAVLPAAAEGAAYGGLYGAGEAKPGERLKGAGYGAAIGGATAGALQGISNAIATRGAQKAANASAPTSDDLANQARQFYKASEAEGVKIRGNEAQNLAQRLKSLIGTPNERLRPKSMGYLDEIDDVFGKGDITLEAFDEFWKGLNKTIGKAEGTDQQRLLLMKQQLSNFRDSLQPGQFSGNGQKAVGYLKEAQKNWARSAKTETVERIIDQAGVDGAGKYTQSGTANAIRREMNTLYKAIKKGKEAGWSKDEIALIRQMASGGSSSKVLNLFAKFAPRGAVSFMAGQLAGSAIPIAGNVALPLGAEIAARSADRAAIAAAQRLATGAATGAAPVAPQIARKTAPFIGGGTAGILELLRQPQRQQGILSEGR